MKKINAGSNKFMPALVTICSLTDRFNGNTKQLQYHPNILPQHSLPPDSYKTKQKEEEHACQQIRVLQTWFLLHSSWE